MPSVTGAPSCKLSIAALPLPDGMGWDGMGWDGMG